MRHINRILGLLFAFAIATTSATSQNTVSMTLEEAIAYGLKNDLNIRNAQINIADAEEQIKESRSTGLPQVNGKISYNYFIKVPSVVLPPGVFNNPETIKVPGFQLKNNLTPELTISNMLFDGSYLVAIKAAKNYRSMVTLQLQAKEDEIRNNIISTYLSSLLISESIATLNKNISNLEKLLNDTKETFKAGFAEQLDVDRLELSKSTLLTERDNLLRQKQMAVNGLKLAISYPVDQPLEVSDDLKKQLDASSGWDLEKQFDPNMRPEIQVQNSSIILQQQNVDLYKMAFYPTLSGFISGSYSVQSNNLFKDQYFIPTALVGLTANVPIWDSGGRRARLQKAKLAVDIATNQKEMAVRGLKVEVENARISYQNAKVKEENQQANLRLAERIYATTQKKYKEGVGSSLEMSTDERAMYQAQQNYIQAQYDVLIARNGLRKALGLK